jgi:poly-gamma-glutamate synthesis protein (capsule biosynthesis protein)
VTRWIVVLVLGCALGVAAYRLVSAAGVPAGAAAAPAPTTAASTTPTSTTPPPTAPRSTTTLVETTVPPRGELVIQGVGDTNFDPDYITDFRQVGYAAAFEGLEGIFLDDDITVVNLECPPTDVGAQADKEYSFRCDPAALPVMAEHGVEVANLANNHSQDRGAEGLLDSIENVRAAGMSPVGVGANLGEAVTPALIEVDGWTVAVLGMGGIHPNVGWLATEDRPGMADGDDIEQMVASVKAAAAHADVVVVTIHWGTELVTEPDPGDRERAEAMIAAGADVIFGHHAHRLGEMELIDGAPVFWTLGNFVWPRLSDAGATTAVARVTVSPDGPVEACLIPAFIERSGRPELQGESGCRSGR